MHIPKLTAVTFINDEYNFFILICIHNPCILRTLNSVGHLLYRCDDQLFIFILHLLDKYVCPVSGINGSGFKFIKFLCCLGIQIFTVNQKYNLLDIWICSKYLCRLKGSQCFSCTGSMPDIGVSVCQSSLTHKSFNCIYLIWPHYHQVLIGIIQYHIACKHLDDMIPRKKIKGKIFQIRDSDIIKISPEKSKAMHPFLIRICKVFCINSVGNNKKLYVVVQTGK